MKPTVDDIYTQSWDRQYIQKTVEPGEAAKAFHVTKLENLVSGNALAGRRRRLSRGLAASLRGSADAQNEWKWCHFALVAIGCELVCVGRSAHGV